jgi:hypothetical protein
VSYSPKTALRASLILLVFGLAAFPAAATDPPDTELNPESGYIETTDSFLAVDDYEIRHVINLGNGYRREIEMVTDADQNDNGPRLAITDAGNSWVVWWRDDDTDEVLIRRRDYSDNSWSDETLISNKMESSRNPEIACDGSDIWVVYELDDAGDTSIGVRMILDDPHPVGIRAVVGATTYSEDLDTEIHTSSGHLWVTWVDSAAYVAWTAYDYTTESWSAPEYEDYSNDSVEDARDRIGNGILE